MRDKLLEQLKASRNAENIKSEFKHLGKFFNAIISSDLYNSRFKLFIQYTEYLSEQGTDSFTIAFSTTDSNLE